MHTCIRERIKRKEEQEKKTKVRKQKSKRMHELSEYTRAFFAHFIDLFDLCKNCKFPNNNFIVFVSIRLCYCLNYAMVSMQGNQVIYNEIIIL